MTGVAALAILSVTRSRQLFSLLIACAGLLFSAGCIGTVLSTQLFFLTRLLSYALFIYLPLLLFVSTVVFAQERRRILSMFCGIAALALVAIAIDAFLVEPKWLEETTHTLTSDKINVPIRVALVADLQTDGFGNYEQNALQRCMSYQPDLILLAGDYVQVENKDAWLSTRLAINDFLKTTHFSAPLGVYAVQGNVDHPEWQRIFEGADVERIKETRSIDVADNVRLTGLSIMDSFDRNLNVEGSGSLHIVVGHAPDYALGNIDADLLLSGHTHGGQVRLPFIGPLMTASQIPRSWAAGRTQLDADTTLIVSRGVGMERGNAPRLRFLCRPQLVIIDIQPFPAADRTQ